MDGIGAGVDNDASVDGAEAGVDETGAGVNGTGASVDATDAGVDGNGAGITTFRQLTRRAERAKMEV